MDGKDTDHSFYLLAGKVVNDSRAANLQIFRVREQRVYRNLGRHPYVADVVADILILMRPLRYVEQPFRAAEILEHICQLSEAIKALTLETFRKISENTEVSTNVQRKETIIRISVKPDLHATICHVLSAQAKLHK